MEYIKLILTLFAGGIVTSAVEYYLKYNLYDLLKDKITGLFHKKAS